jgi:pilus assembly protein CpaC
MSGHLAHFRVGGEVPYSYQNENGFNVVEFKEFGIVLDMTPNVDSQGNIRLNIIPTVRTIDQALAIAGIPGFRTREMNTTVQLRPGESLVIGGLIQHEITKIVSEIPFLSQIPVLGELFRSHRFNDDETELVIFLTPYIIENAAQSVEIVDIDPESEMSE